MDGGNKMKFSVIVPVYNVQEFLPMCLDSLVNQKNESYEIILVNDGSTDNSRKICEEYQNKYENIRIINKTNGGLSDARNTGLDVASGEYIVFVDSDDYIDLNSLDEFSINLNKYHNPDVLVTKIMKKFNNDVKYMDNLSITFNHMNDKSSIIEWMFTKSDSLWPAVRYVVKRDFIINNNLQFLEGYFHEDIDWTLKLFIHAETFGFCEHYWYVHRISRVGSITNTVNPKRLLDVIEIISSGIKYIEKTELEKEVKKIMCTRIVKNVYTNMHDYKFYIVNDKIKIALKLKENSSIFKYTTKIQHKIFNFASKLLGFRLSLAIMSVLKQW